LDFFSEDIIKETERLDRDGFLYFIGDVRNDIYRQTSIAVGNGVLAAMKIYRREVEDAL
jgi:thioredoxin reductase